MTNMSKRQLLKILRSLLSGDPEADHAKADKALIEFINDKDIAKAYEAIEKWYA
jgi:hypothetical protein